MPAKQWGKRLDFFIGIGVVGFLLLFLFVAANSKPSAQEPRQRNSSTKEPYGELERDGKITEFTANEITELLKPYRERLSNLRKKRTAIQKLDEKVLTGTHSISAALAIAKSAVDEAKSLTNDINALHDNLYLSTDAGNKRFDKLLFDIEEIAGDITDVPDAWSDYDAEDIADMGLKP